jgi:hypothetical protein
MLVKCISYIITVFGTKRYKPFLFVGVAVIATLVGVNTIISAYQPTKKPVASSVDTAETDQQTYDSQNLGEQKLKQQSKQEAELPTEPAVTAPNESSSPSTPSTTTPSSAPTLQATQETVIIKVGSTSTTTTVGVSLSDASSAQWSFKTDQINGLTITPADKQSGNTYNLTIKSDSNATIGTHTLVFGAKDTVRNLELTKAIKLVIVAE